MSTTSTPDSGADAPLTRRQRRALERAQEMAQQERQDAYTEDLPAISQPPEEPRSSSAPSAGAPALSTVESEARPETRGRSAVPSQDSSRPWRPVEDGSASMRPTADGQGDDHRAALPGELRDDQDDDLEHPGGGLLDERNAPETTPPRRTLRGPLGSMPRGPLAVALIGIVILAMILVPLAVDKFVTGRYGPDASPVAQQTVLDGNAPLNQLLTISGRLGSGSAPSIALANEASLSAPSSVLTDVVETGHGRVVSEGSPVILQVSQFSGLDGRNTTGNADGYKLWRNMLSPAAGDYINAAVSGQREGTRVVLRAPAEDSSTAEITIVDILPTTATGETKEPAPGTPAVTEGEDGSITVSSAGLPVPTRAATAILIKGTGPQIGSQDKVIVRRTMVSWATGQALGESTFGYQNLPKRIDMSDALVGVSQNLVDITVGSRVVLSLPAEQAKGTEPVVVVIDVLAIDNDSESSAG
ncbi:hypothetical protein [Actinomyces sp. oral taxon 849]|uniref:hypothetical protein n=1 Tax=Actinomyces sp. oral taxon 849 TaxID=653385 RepID=UPI001E3FC8E4|nr:hypothetical protein [Actinomyces sp. oral taxon 849]